ncbi:site-2 protease family protein [Candidatus Marsarchaeota archaeon]|nr:site-2 protease family protein [Candidatus Marsarchaeota archaeon]
MSNATSQKGSRFTPLQKNAITIGIFVLEFAIIAFCYFASFLGLINQVLIAIITLIISGMAIQKLRALHGGYGFYMIGGTKGISVIDSISKKSRWFWENMPTWGIVLGFGIFSYFLLKGKLDKRVFIIGLLSLGAFIYFIMPCTGLPLQFISLPGFQSYSSLAASACTTAPLSNLSITGDVIYLLTLVFGFSGFLIAALLLNAANVLSSSLLYLVTAYVGAPQTALLTSQIPGVAPIIPGVDIPFIAGIAALIVILIIHEFSHGVLARMAKAKIKSIGLLIFGVVPVGAFVEPEEKEIARLSKRWQNNISAAGISANFIATIVFFVITIAMLYFVVPNLYQNNGVFIQAVQPNTPANGILAAGEQILSWNGHAISNITDLELAGANDMPGSIVRVIVSPGSCATQGCVTRKVANYSIAAVSVNGSSRGYIGIIAYQKEALATTPYAKGMYFIYTFVSLSFLLNFLVGIVNLLPIPGFDGWRIYKTNINSRFAIRFVIGLVIAGLILNAVPWLFIGLLH